MDEQLRKKFKKGIKLSLAISVVVTLSILIITVEEKTLLALKEVRVSALFLILGLWILAIFFDGLRLHIITKAGDRTLSIRKSIEVILTGNFLAAVTPFQTGGFPLQLYIMNRENIGPGRAMAFLLFRGLMIYVPVFLVASVVAYSLGFLVKAESFIINFLIKYIFVLLTFVVIVVTFFLLKPEKTETFLLKLKNRIRNKFIAGILNFLVEETVEFKLGLGLFLKNHNIKYLIGAIVVSVFALLFYIGIVPAILFGLGLDVNIVPVMAMQALIMALLLFIPTPGAGGVAEIGGAALFALVCPKHLLGVFVVLWRFFTFYLGALIGGIIAIKEF